MYQTNLDLLTGCPPTPYNAAQKQMPVWFVGLFHTDGSWDSQKTS